MPVALSPTHVTRLQSAVDAILASPAGASTAAWARSVSATGRALLGARAGAVAVAPAGEPVRWYGDGSERADLRALADPERLPAAATVRQPSHDVATWVVVGLTASAAAGLLYESLDVRVHFAWLLAGMLTDADAARTRALLDLLAPVLAAAGRARAHAGPGGVAGHAPAPHVPGVAAPVDDRAADALAAALGDEYALTARETQVARHLLRGWPNTQLACALGISESTARHHTERVLAKLGVRSRAEVAWLAFGHLTTPPTAPVALAAAGGPGRSRPPT